MTQATVVKPAVEVTTCATCPHFNDFNESNGRGWCGLFDHYARKHHIKTNDCVLQSQKSAPTQKNSLFRVYNQVEIKGSICFPPVLYSVIAFKLVESESPAYYQYEISNGEQTFLKQEKDLVLAGENQVIEPSEAFPTEEIIDEANLPRSKYQTGSLVKIIDSTEHHTEWATFEIIECRYNKDRYLTHESYTSQADWSYRLHSASKDTEFSFWVQEDEICDADMAWNVCTLDVF